MQNINPTTERKLVFDIYYDYEFNCWCCDCSLDIEDKLFANRCNGCNSSQGYDKEVFGW